MNKRFLLGIVALVFAASLFARWMFYTPGSDLVATPPEEGYVRLVSLAPSITETLFALGLGDRVQGVTRYCDYPPEAQQRPRVGGFLDPNYEAIVALEPDVVLLLTIHAEAKERLAALDIDTLTVDHRTLDGILDSFRTVGDACNVSDIATEVIADCEARMQRVRSKTADLDHPRVLVSSARELGKGRVGSVYAAGKGQWYDNLIEYAGGENAFQDALIQFPQISAEGLLRLNPDVVIELAPELASASYTAEDVRAEWNSLADMKAVQSGRVYVLDGDYVSIPGPRFVDTLEDMARVLHPEVDWSTP